MNTRHQQALDYIQSTQRTTVTGPTVRAVAEKLGIHATAAQRVVTALRGKGLLKPEAGCGLVVHAVPVYKEAPAPQKVSAQTPVRQPIPKPNGKL